MSPLPPPPPSTLDDPDHQVVVPPDGADTELTASTGRRLVSAIDAVVADQHDVAEIAVAALFSAGHLLIEDVPGVGKTLLAQVLARATGLGFSRVQGTPDLLPGDITGTMMPVLDGGGVTRLEFRPGPIFANVVVVDELNRATPRTQSALLEAAEESTVTVDGRTHPLPDPFMVVATQNPLEVAGTYALGEGSLDRFAAVVSPGRASPEYEVDVVTGRRGRTMLGAIEPVADADRLRRIRRHVSGIAVSDAVGSFVVDLLEATRRHPGVRLGASTRAGVSLVDLARGRAGLAGRDFVTPDDVVGVAVASLGHRVLTDGDGSTDTGRRVVSDCLSSIEIPSA